MSSSNSDVCLSKTRLYSKPVAKWWSTVEGLIVRTLSEGNRWESNSLKISKSDIERLKWRTSFSPKEKPTLGVRSLIRLYNYKVTNLALHTKKRTISSVNGVCSVILSDSTQSQGSSEKTRACGAMDKWWIKMADVLEPRLVLKNIWDDGKVALIWARFGRTTYEKNFSSWLGGRLSCIIGIKRVWGTSCSCFWELTVCSFAKNEG